jgi:hypothetical protein
MVDEDVINDLKLAREVISTTETSLVIVQYGKIWKQKKGEGIKPILETIEEMGDDLNDAILGTKFLDKASALLCRYAKVNGVYSPQATKTGIALLIMAGIPSQIDKMISDIKDIQDESLHSIEKILEGVDSPEEAYKILKEKNLEKK